MMNWLISLALMMQPAGEVGATPAAPAAVGSTEAAQEAANQAAESAAAGLTPAERAAADLEALQNITVDDLTWDNFVRALPGIWSTYGLPLVKALIVFIVAWLIAGWIKRALIAAMGKAKVEITLAKFLGNTVRWAILLIAGVSILGIVGIETTSFAAVLAAMGFAIGLALSGALGNLAAGVMLMLFRPFRVGDSIVTGGVTGVVDEIELFSTTVITPDNRKFILPNGAVFNTTIENQTANPRRGVSVTMTINGGSDIAKARAAFLEAARGVEGRAAESEPTAALTDLTGGQVWTVGVWAPTPAFATVKERLLIACKAVVDKNALAVPMPQQIVNFKQLPV